MNGVEIPKILSGERPLDVLGVGSLIPVKNWEKWLRVIALATQTFPHLRAELIGSGPERGKLERLAHRLGLSENVRFVGDLPRPEVLARMRDAKVLLHTADFESFGYVLAEAAGSGCRVVSTAVGIAPTLGVVAENEKSLAKLVVEGLGALDEGRPFVPFTMEETAAAYLRVYG
jgi:glycosyltransferase involved in cell wall biosynthesis